MRDKNDETTFEDVDENPTILAATIADGKLHMVDTMDNIAITIAFHMALSNNVEAEPKHIILVITTFDFEMAMDRDNE